MFRACIIILLIVFGCCFSAFSQTKTDILQMALDSVGFTRDDLGCQPKGYWNRFPLDIPYRLTSFDDLFAEPLKLYDYSKTMANAVEKYLDSAFLDTTSTSLYYLTYWLGVDRKLGGFRNYSANLIPVQDSIKPLETAMLSLFNLAEEESLYPSENELVDWQKCKRGLNPLTENISKEMQLILAKLIVNITDIIKWRNLAFRDCSRQTMEKIFNIKELALTQADGIVYYPEMDDIAATIDYPALHYAALKAAAITEESADSLLHYDGKPSIDYFETLTPYGRVIFIGSDYSQGNETESIICDNTLLVIDFGGDNIFTGSCGANINIANSVSIFINLGGDDKYISDPTNSSQGAGILGVGILYDAAGNDIYEGKEHAQGTGLFGVGILMDLNGDDKYRAELSGQGCGYFGIGLCFDAGGNDSFYIYGSGQGFGGVGGGIGVLADYAGNDSYVGEPSPEVFDMADYHSDMKINGNSVQGVGLGRRGDITDGHSWAGGLGAIIDIKGSDHYFSGNWSLGCAYWFSTGIAYDGTGDDVYESCYFTQGSGAHFCNGILIDEGGNDRHKLYETAGAALGFGWDYANAFLINIGGDDSYRANMISIGLAEIRSNAFLIDIGGNDVYRLKSGALGLGAVDYHDYYRKPAGLSIYFSDSKSFGCLIDIGGADKYISFTDTSETAHSSAGNNRTWFIPARTDSAYGADNYGIGIDIEEGIIPEIERWK